MDGNSRIANIAPFRKKLDPNAPKPPKSAFQFYIIENKDSITAENSDKSSGKYLLAL